MNFIKKYYAKQFRNIIDPRRFVIHKSLEKILISAKFIRYNEVDAKNNINNFTNLLLVS